MRGTRKVAAGVVVAALAAGCSGAVAPDAAGPADIVVRCLITVPDEAGAAVVKARLVREVDRYLSRQPGRVVYAAHDLKTGIRLGRGAREHDMITASGAKVDILMALLTKRGRLGTAERDLATLMIRHSDNRAADALWWRAGGGAGLAAFYRAAGLRETVPGPGRYWGGTTTSPADRLELLRLLVEGGGGLSTADRRLVLGLMARVHREQAWGVSAAARPGDRVALKNGWTPRPFVHNTWAVTSYGRVTGPGRDLLLAVQTDRQPNHGRGIQAIEGLSRLIGSRLEALSPWRTRACAAQATT
ncbi:serine hydrolase [Nonomuraea sp. NPDC048826]|uniref:serine hydrolase n=1 Tax=Nonomuraea sp. NPDC048826 TaxID=3364347 RepID=UPI0037210859